ncbi:DUF2515 domain-containing protein [Paenibacillus tarimensis]
MDRDKRGRKGRDGRIRRLLSFPGDMLRYLAGKWRGRSLSKRMADRAHPLPVKAALVDDLIAAWSKITPDDDIPSAAHMEAALPLGSLPPLTPPAWGVTAEERAVVARIRKQTVRMNRNNVTRTAAYLAFYRRYPEVHWAFLAHMVSRNGGWNMTDLQGELLPRLLNRRQREATFQFLERANALIFGDAYPQLLLYEAGAASGRDLTHLLRYFGVSKFMEPVWTQFRRSRDPVPLTIALIVNEQHFIERRVVQHPYYRKEVLETAFFGLQSLLQLNQVLFPYSTGKDNMKLSGIILEDFKDLRERIEFGKRLYAMLFGVPGVQRGAYAFACAAAHTGSRADYAPQLFTSVRHRPPQRKYRERLEGGRLRPGAEPLYSPELAFAWPDRPIHPAEEGDWFVSGADAAGYFKDLPLPASFEITNEYAFALGKIELAVLAKEKLGPIVPK